MKILALESSAVACSVALCEDDFLIAQSFQNNGLTHSVTLMPMCEDMLKNCGVPLTMGEIDVIAVAAGPGSFTGLRIGVSAAKGLGWGMERPCAKVSTLEAMAWNVALWPGELCCVMDARRGQVYNARFRSDGERIERLCPDRAISVEELGEELKNSGKEQILVGDGAQLCYNQLIKMGLSVRVAPPNLRYQSAWGVARAALEQARGGLLITAEQLLPEYHRLSQAERERLEREKAQKVTEGE